MTSCKEDTQSARCIRRGFSLVEVVICIGIVGIMLVAALNTVAVAKTMERKIGERTRGLLLAEQLMSEILITDYADKDGGADSFGLGSVENTGDRSEFDDVDDYDNWSASPPQNKDGTEITHLTGWTRSVDVAWVTSTNLNSAVSSNTGIKRITVTVKFGGAEVASLTAYRTNGADKSSLRSLENMQIKEIVSGSVLDLKGS